MILLNSIRNIINRDYRLASKSFKIISKDGLKGFWIQYKEYKKKMDKFRGPSSIEIPLPQDAARIRASSPYDVIIFPIIDWDFRFQRPQQIAVRFSKNIGRVFYVQSAFSSEDNPLLRRIQEDIIEVLLPGNGLIDIYQDALDEVTLKNIIRSFDILRKEYDIVEAIIIVDLPFWTKAAFGLRDLFGWRVIYDCMDCHRGFSNISKLLLNEEKFLSEKSDLILASSNLLFNERSLQNPKCILVPNGTDFFHFSSEIQEKPEELKDLKGPLIGYYGAISDWFDSELVGSLARSRSDWNFILIGHTFGSDTNPLEGLKNIFILGEKPYDLLPSYLHFFDVCIIPFKKNQLTEATNPVKLFEYFSAGKPVVATDLTELRFYKKWLTLASGTQEWLKAIESYLKSPNGEFSEKRKQFAQKNTWDDRFEQINDHAINLFPKVSIIMLTFNNLDLTRICLESIYKKTGYPNFEVIVVDNASSDGTREFLIENKSQFPNIKIILNDNNEGFARGNNRGFHEAKGEFVVFLNNDTIVTHGWIGRLIRHIERDPTIGMIGPTTNEIANEARIDVPYSNLDQIDAFAYKRAIEYAEKGFDIKVLAMFCVLIPTKIFKEVGRLDEQYEIGMFEDDDLALRVKNAGYRLVCAEDVFIHHYGCAGFKPKLRSF